MRPGPHTSRDRTSHAWRRLVVRGREFSREAESSRARRRLVVRGSCSGKLVGDAANWLKTGRLASVGLAQGLLSSLS
jgi:hypothetical protein